MSKAFKIIIVAVLVSILVMGLAACSDDIKNVVPDGDSTPTENVVRNDGPASNGGETDKQNSFIAPNPNSLANLSETSNDSSTGTVSYKASFVTNNGGTLDAIDTWVLEAAPTIYRNGYVFIGWYLESDFSGTPVTFPYVMNANTTFYACWQSVGYKPVSTVEDLIAIGTDEASMSADYYLTNDIDLEGKEWKPIGLNYEFLYDEEGKVEYLQLKGENAPQMFIGSLDGNGYTIYNMTITPTVSEKEANYLPYGLFARIGTGIYNSEIKTASIKNLRINNYKINVPSDLSRLYVGGLVGIMESGIVTNCHSIGSIVNPQLIYEEGIWDDFFGSYANPTERADFGGLIGAVKKYKSNDYSISALVSKCSTQGTIVSESVANDVNIGGLVGNNDIGVITRCHASVDVKGRYAGGLVGLNAAEVNNSYAVGKISCNRYYPTIGGGLIGFNSDTGIVKQSYATGEVTARTAGGLIGITNFNYMKAIGGIVSDCLSTGNVYADEYGGGLIGRVVSDVSVDGKINNSTVIVDGFYFVKNCMAFGNVTTHAELIVYTKTDGTVVESTGVYHAVFAGGLIGQAQELRISGCIAYGNVSAKSVRPVSDTTAVVNPAYADNFIGQSTNTLEKRWNNVYGSTSQTVYRNGDRFENFNTVPTLAPNGVSGATHLSSKTFLLSIGFSETIWNLDNVDITEARYPGLII